MKKKILALVLVFALAMVLGVGGTMAWLTSKTDTVVNTFTVGNITLELNEYIANPEYDPEDKESEEYIMAETDAQKSFKIIPGSTDKKKPVLKVIAGSEKCYVYALVDNTLLIDGTVVATLDIDTGLWEPVKNVGTQTLYRYKDIIDVTDKTEDDDSWTASVFTKVEYSTDITMENIGSLKNKTITIKGYAHQSDNVTPAEVDTAAMEYFKLNTSETP